MGDDLSITTGRQHNTTTTSHITFLFWNVGRADRSSLIADLVSERKVDVIVLAEDGATADVTLRALRGCDERFFSPQSAPTRLRLYARDPALDLKETYFDSNGRMTIRSLRCHGVDLLFGAVHLISRPHHESGDQAAEAQVLADLIREEEDRHHHHRTVLCGDLNMNPFERGVAQASGFHAMMTRAEVRREYRTVQGRNYRFFYNPMWGMFGDRTAGPPGTYYYRAPGHLSYDWNIFDQVLIRPEALPWFQDDVEVVTRIRETSLMDSNGRPRASVGSDHFPIEFRLVALD